MRWRLPPGAIFIEFILWLRAPPESPRRVRLNAISIPLRVDGMRCDFAVKGNLVENWKTSGNVPRQTDDKALEILKEERVKYSEIESINLSEKLRNEIKLFSCDFYDMYPLRSKCCFYPNAGWQYGDAILLRKRNFVKYWRILQEMQQWRDSEIEGQTFSKDENGALRELSRFVTLKDFEGNRHYLIAVSVEWILQFCHSQYRWFRSKRYFHFVARQ